MADIQAVFSALDVFSRAPDKGQLERANTWLQDFQHSSEAWSTCSVLLLSPNTPPAAKLFAAQTFRTKVTYDLNQVAHSDLLPLRDTLMKALETYQTGPRTIIVQLCLALSDLALQLPEWHNCVQDMIDSFGRNPSTVPLLLQFLTVLPDEVNSNTRIPITDEDYAGRSASLLTANSRRVLEVLTMYIQAQGVTPAVQLEIFRCLSNWLIAGEITALSLAQTPLLDYAFQALASDDLFETAVDVICDIIHETQEIDDNKDVIEVIVPRVIGLKPLLVQFNDDPEKIRGLARIFAEAGETYRVLVLHHTETFSPLVEAIGQCSAYPDLDIVPITFTFWMRLAQGIRRKPSVSPLFHDAYRTLMGIVIGHLHFPNDTASTSNQEAEAFRNFRHVMGDTLKDCCVVLGTERCLTTAYELVTSALTRAPSVLSWQEVEAPLFSMRSMGAEIDVDDDKVIPKIMDLIPSLPDHPKIRYATLLIIARYTEWTNNHPDYLPSQLQYISAGFINADQDVNMAAGQALKYVCQDCKRHLESFLPQLHSFVSSTGAKLAQEERVQVYAAIAHVISAMNMERAAQSLRTFALDILATIHAASKSGMASKEEFKESCYALENLEVMLSVIRTFGDELPTACQNTCQEAWTCLDLFISKYGTVYEASDRATRLLRHGITFFGSTALSIIPSVLARMTSAFEATGMSGYIWIVSKIVGAFGDAEDPAVRTAFKDAYVRIANKVFSLLQDKSPGAVPDVLEDYMQLLSQVLEHTPDIFFETSAFPIVFRAALAALTLIQTDLIFASLDLIRDIVTHECLSPESGTVPPPKFPIYAAVIGRVIEKEGFELVGYLLSGLVGDFPEDSTSTIITIFRMLAAVWPGLLLSWLPPVLQQLPTTTVSDQAKTQFMSEITSSVNAREWDKVKYGILTLHRTSLKARDRRRATLDR